MMKLLFACIVLLAVGLGGLALLTAMESDSGGGRRAIEPANTDDPGAPPTDDAGIGAWLAKLEQAAAVGSPDAQFETALVYLDEASLASQQDRGVHWLRTAAEAGHVRAMELLGALHHQGRYVEADPALAHEWMRRAAEAGSDHARVILAQMYFTGTGAPADDDAGLRLAREAAESGFPGGQLALGTAYQHARGVPCDLERATQLYEQARDGGDPAVAQAARNRLEQLREAAPWFQGLDSMRARAEDGDPEAQFLFGYVHAWGLCTPVDEQAGAEWMERAAAQGLAPARQAADWLRARRAK